MFATTPKCILFCVALKNLLFLSNIHNLCKLALHDYYKLLFICWHFADEMLCCALLNIFGHFPIPSTLESLWYSLIIVRYKRYRITCSHEGQWLTLSDYTTFHYKQQRTHGRNYLLVYYPFTLSIDVISSWKSPLFWLGDSV